MNIITIRDRFTKGLVAGIAGGIVMSAVDLIFTALGWVKSSYYDWGLSLIRGSTAETIFEAAIGVVIHLIFAAILGIVFAYMVLLISSRNYLIKGWFYGFFVWFSVHVIVNLFTFQPLRPIPISQILADFLTASIFGIVMAETLHRLSPEKVG